MSELKLTREEEILRLKVQLAQARDYLSFKDVMVITGLSSSTLHRRLKSGQLKAIQHVEGGKLLFLKSDFFKLICSNPDNP